MHKSKLKNKKKHTKNKTKNNSKNNSVIEQFSQINLEQNDWSEFVQSLEESHECSICLESFNLKSNKIVKSSCNHYYCKSCYDQINICSLCRTNFNKNNQLHNLLQHHLQQHNQPNQQNQLNGSLYVDYVYLDANERRRFANQQHEYLINQIQQSQQQFRLNFNHPVRSLIWNR
jgi:hypothetical protein